MQEILQKRDLYSKHFLNEDNTITTQIHSAPIHYFNENNELEDVDLQILQESNWELEYVVKKNNFKAYFNDTADDNFALISLEIINKNKTKRWINLKPYNANPVNYKIMNNKLIYYDLYENIDYEYIVTSTSLKENIIINNQLDINKLSFTLKTDGTNCKLADNKIQFYDNDTDELLWILESPYVIDSNNTIKYCIIYQLNEIEYKNKIYSSIDLIIDKNEIENLQYPLIIDPTISPYGELVGMAYRSGTTYPPTSQTSTRTDMLRAYGIYQNGTYCVSVVGARFNVSSIPSGSIINSANIYSTWSMIYNDDDYLLQVQWYDYSDLENIYIDSSVNYNYRILLSQLAGELYLNANMNNPSFVSNKIYAGARFFLSGNIPTGYNNIELSNIYISISYTEPTPVRPNNWSWSYSITSGGAVYDTIISGNIIYAYIMTAIEWNNFCTRINEFRIYKGLLNYSFTTVASENNCTHTIINQAISAINELGFTMSSLNSGVDIPASAFTQMRDNLNSIV